jgi:hypothetical protein
MALLGRHHGGTGLTAETEVCQLQFIKAPNTLNSSWRAGEAMTGTLSDPGNPVPTQIDDSDSEEGA